MIRRAAYRLRDHQPLPRRATPHERLRGALYRVGIVELGEQYVVYNPDAESGASQRLPTL